MKNKKLFKCPPRIVLKWKKHSEYYTRHEMCLIAKDLEETNSFVYLARIKGQKKQYVIFIKNDKKGINKEEKI